jgi:hypothetical protein
MRFFAAMTVATLGIGCYAVAALLYDRRRQLAGWRDRRRAPAPATAAGPPSGTDPASSVYLFILASVVVGSALLVGACVGLIVF